MNEIVIRNARLEDIKEITEVRQQVWATTYRGIYDDEVIDNFNYEKEQSSMMKKIDQKDIMFKVATLNNKIVGYVCFGKTDDKYKNCNYVIYYIHILKDYQGHGLGTKFFSMVGDYAHQNHIKNFYVSCNKYNYSAHKYYEKMGGVQDHIDSGKENKQAEHIIYIYKMED